LFRKSSPLICMTLEGEHVMRKECEEIAPGIFVERDHRNTVKLEDGSYTHSSYCLRIGRKSYLKTDERVIKDYQGEYCLKEDCVQLSTKYYSGVGGKPKFAEKNRANTVVQLPNGDWVLVSDTREVLSWENNEQKLTVVHKSHLTTMRYVSGVFLGFKDPTNPQLDRLDTTWALETETVVCAELGIRVLMQQHDWLQTECRRIAAERDARTTEAFREKCNKAFSDCDETENTAKKISTEFKTYGGKEHIMGGIGEAILSRQYTLTGGIGYTFGLEIETSAGRLSADLATALGIEGVGDRSIGAVEYVTSPLQGNRGINHVKKVVEALAASTFVDDRCSVHVHVGSPPPGGATDYSINFNKEFAIAAIKLGTSIEEDLYKTLPKSRHPYNKYCHSIMRFAGINQDNWRNYLGAFVFAPEHENWKEKLDFNRFLYGDAGMTKDSRLGTWCGGRYKWLNLVRGFSSCNARTIEFRIFSPSTNFDKVYNYILISLGFTHVCNKYQKLVMETKMTLEEMLCLAYKDSPELLTGLLLFIEERKAKFNRTVVYDKIKPHEIISVEPRVTSEKLVAVAKLEPEFVEDDEDDDETW
jgi:hypothetical protein